MHAADLFLTFDDEFDVDQQPSGGLQVRFDRLQVREQLPFVIGCAAGNDLTVADLRCKRGRGPLVQRIGWLDVIMTIKQNGGAVGRVQPFAVDCRVSTGWQDLDAIQADSLHLVGDPVGRAFHVAEMFRQRAYAGDAQQVQQLVEVLVLVFGSVKQGPVR